MTAAASPLSARIFTPVSRDWEQSSALVRILCESLLVVGVTLLCAHWLNPDDPFGIHAQFPWIWIAPVLLAMRYGTIDGALATGILLAAWLLPAPYGMTGRIDAPAFPQEYFLGGLVLVLIAGQFADVWNGRLARIRASNAFLDERLTSLTRAHYLLRLSHQRLEHELLVRPVTLSDLITELRPLESSDQEPLARADAVLRLIGGSCDVEAAAIYEMRDGSIVTQPAATIGDMSDLDPTDPLVSMALDAQRLVHVRASDATLYRSRYLVACPINPSGSKPLAILVVRAMPFFALNDENLQFLAVLTGYYADGLVRSKSIHAVRLLRPNVPPDFALELVRMKRLYEQAGVDSTLLALGFPRIGDGHLAFEHVRRTRRSTDSYWELDTGNRHQMLLLMPLSGPPDLEGMLIRMEASLRQQFNKGFSELGIAVHHSGMIAAEPEWLLDDMLNRCGVNDDIAIIGEARA